MLIKFIRNRTSTFIVMYSFYLLYSWLPPSFTVSNFKNTKFLDRVPSGLPLCIRIKAFILEYRRSWEMFKHYNIATVMIDSTILDNLKFLYEITGYNYLKRPFIYQIP